MKIKIFLSIFLSLVASTGYSKDEPKWEDPQRLISYNSEVKQEINRACRGNKNPKLCSSRLFTIYENGLLIGSEFGACRDYSYKYRKLCPVADILFMEDSDNFILD